MSIRKTFSIVLVAALAVFGAEGRQLKVLAIGNSFSRSLMAELPKAAAAFPDCELDIANMFIGGCTLDWHWANVERAETNALYRPYEITASYAFDKRDFPKRANIQEMLKADRWDVVTIQQGSVKSAFAEAYQPFADKLIGKIRELAPQAEIRIHQTWSYSPYSGRLAKWKLTPETMFAQVREAYAKLAAQHGFKVIPVGEAVRLYRERLPVRYGKVLSAEEVSALEEPATIDFCGDVVGNSSWAKDKKSGRRKLKVDSIHLNKGGRYLQACVWLASLFDVDVRALKYEPTIGGFAEKARLMRECAATAVGSGK